MEDISELAPLTSSAPQEAADNINHGNLFSVDPKYVKENKPLFDEKAQQILKPQQAEKPVADYMKQDQERAALATPDVEHLNFMARQSKMIGDYMFDRPSVEQKIVDLNLKKMNQGGQLSDDDEIALSVHNHDAQELQNRDYGVSGPIEKIPAVLLGGLSDLGRSAVRGARKGLLEGPFAGNPGLGIAYGTMIKDPFDTLTAGTYNELSNAVDDNGNPRNYDHDTKANIARGVGVVGTTLMNTAGFVVAESAPWMKPFANPRLAAALVNTPAKASILSSIGGLMKSSATVGGATALTEFAKIVGEEMAKGHGTDEGGFWNSLATAAERVKENKDQAGSRVLEAGGTGAVFGFGAEALLQIAGLGRTKQNFSNYVEKPPAEGPLALPPGPSEPPGSGPVIEGEFSRPSDNEFKQKQIERLNARETTVKGLLDEPEKLSPQQKVNLEKELKDIQGKQKLHQMFEEPTTVKDLTPPEEPSDPTKAAVKSLQMNEALHQVNDVQKATTMEKVAPTELKEAQRRSLIDAGFENFFSSLSELKDWATSEEKGRAARDLIDPSGVASGQINASVALASHEVMHLAKKYPDILDHISHDPDLEKNPTAIRAKEYVEALHRAEEKRKEVMQGLGIKPEDVQPEQGNVGGKSVAELPVKPPQAKPDFEAYAQATGELLSEKKATEQYITEKTAMLEQLKNAEVPNIADKETIRKLELGLKNAPKQIEDIDKAFESLKAKVTEHLKENPPGSLLMFPFDEKKSATNAEMKFGREPTFSEALRTVLPEKQVQGFDEAVLRARQHVTNMVHDQAVHEMNKVVDQTAEIAKEERFREELNRIAHDPNYAVVDQFHRHQIANAKGKAKRSMYSIDPASLPDDMLHYTQNARLKKHKVFAKGGSTADESARALGFQTGRDLLDVLAKTPIREEIVKARASAYDSDIEKLAQENVDLDHTSIMKAFTDKTKAYLETMRFLKDTDWSRTKFGIKKIALPLPRIEDIENDARAAVMKMKVSDLRPSQYVVGERQSYRNAVEKFLAGDIAGAFREKENAARNSAMQKEVRKAIAVINRAQKFARKLEDPVAQNLFAAAGPRHQKAKDEILDNFNLNPNKKNQSEQNSFAKWAKREVEQGRGDFTIPGRLSDVRQSIHEMTVEQVMVAEDRLRAVFAEAKYKKELIDDKVKREEERNIDRVAEQAVMLMSKHPGGGGEDNFRPENKTLYEGLGFLIQDAMSLSMNMEHILRFYDGGVFNGFFHQTFMHPIKGDGRYNLKSGYSKEDVMSKRFAENARNIMKNHGDYDNVEKHFIHAPEFKNVKSLRTLTKGDLMVAWAYKGDPDGRDYLQNNFKDNKGKSIPLETWQKVFDRELNEADVTSMQYAVDMYKGYQEETKDLQMRDRGEQVVFIKGVPNRWKDKVFPGGYVHINLKHEFTKEAADRQLKLMEGKRAAWFEGKDGAEYGRQFAAEQTEQGRLESREGSSKELDLSLIRFWRGHEEVIHDLSYREAVKNTLKLLRDKRISGAMIHMGGEARYKLVVNTVIEIAGRAEAMNANYFSDQNRMAKAFFGHLQNNFNITVLGMNIFTSTPIQYEALIQLLQNMGPINGRNHLANINRKLVFRPHLFNGFLNFAVEIDPTIGHFMHQLQNKIESTVHDIIPTKGIMNRVPGWTWIKGSHEKAVNFAMSPMAVADIHLKVMGALAAYSQFMAGDSSNWSREKVLSLPPAERHQQAIAYARQISRLSLTHGRPEDKAPVQKSPITMFFANYWNDARNVLNNQVQISQRAWWAGKAGNKALGQGGGGHGGGGQPPGGTGSGIGDNVEPLKINHGDAFRNYGKASNFLMTMLILYTIGRWGTDKLRGIQQTPDQWNSDLRTAKGREEAGKRMLQYMMLSPADQFLTVQPLLRETFFAEQMPDKVIRGFVDKTKTVQVPVTKIGSDIATAANMLVDDWQETDNLSDFLFLVSHAGDKEMRVLLNVESFIGVPLPVNAYSRFMKWLEMPLNTPIAKAETALDKLSKQITSVSRYAKESGHLDNEAVAQLEDLQKKIAPEIVQVPTDAPDKIKFAMSGGDWTKPDGVYGFKKDQWETIKAAAPELGLTSAGRIAKNTEQQENAMSWLLNENAHYLAQADVKVNNESLYGAYRLGVSEYEKVAKAPTDAKVKSVLSEETLKQNPDLADAKTVGQLKEKLANQLTKKTAELTPPTKTAEDDL